jgi:hypothetical protein
VRDFIPRIDDFVDLLRAVPDEDLGAMDEDSISNVVALCTFGFPWVRVAKVTKVAAFYRPRAVPILDRLIAKAFGYRRAPKDTSSRRAARP